MGCSENGLLAYRVDRHGEPAEALTICDKGDNQYKLPFLNKSECFKLMAWLYLS